jgi:hypothetical protein
MEVLGLTEVTGGRSPGAFAAETMKWAPHRAHFILAVNSF